MKYSFPSVLFALLTLLVSAPTLADRCLFVSSYAPGYAWTDGVTRGLYSSLDSRCEIRQFDMDTKRVKTPQHARQKALEAKALIESWKPDVVITADDAAAKYLLARHYRDAEVPFVFCGVNWGVSEYGFPYRNTTGMIEVSPFRPLLERVRAFHPNIRHAVFIASDTLSARKNLHRYQRHLNKQNIVFAAHLVLTREDWLTAYKAAQNFDLVIIGNNAGIADWDEAEIRRQIPPLTRTLSITTREWLMPYSMLGYTKIPEEQGEWAGKAAISILQGTAANRIPIVPNQRWDIWVNPVLIKASGIEFPDNLLRTAREQR